MHQQFLYLLPDRLGDRGGSAEKSALKGYYAVLEDDPKLRGSSLWGPKSGFLSLTVGLLFREPFQEQLDRWVVLRLVHRTIPVFFLGARVLCPVSSSLAGGSERQPRAEVANAGLNGALAKRKR